MDVNELIQALDNDKNEALMNSNFTTRKINKIKLKILNKIGATQEQIQKILPRLEGYMYVDEIPQFQVGSYLKSIPLEKSYLNLINRGFFFGTKVSENGVLVMCKYFNRFYNLRLDNNLFFQKLSKQQMVILSAMDHLHSEDTDEDTDNDIENDEDTDEDTGADEDQSEE
jgi:hypothetical protein